MSVTCDNILTYVIGAQFCGTYVQFCRLTYWLNLFRNDGSRYSGFMAHREVEYSFVFVLLMILLLGHFRLLMHKTLELTT